MSPQELLQAPKMFDEIKKSLTLLVKRQTKINKTVADMSASIAELKQGQKALEDGQAVLKSGQALGVKERQETNGKIDATNKALEEGFAKINPEITLVAVTATRVKMVGSIFSFIKTYWAPLAAVGSYIYIWLSSHTTWKW